MQLRHKKIKNRPKLTNWQEKMKPLQQLLPQENWKKMLLDLMVCTKILQKHNLQQMKHMKNSTTIGGMSGIQQMPNSMNIMNMKKMLISECIIMKKYTMNYLMKLID